VAHSILQELKVVFNAVQNTELNDLKSKSLNKDVQEVKLEPLEKVKT
jgi:hypothetical protein